MGQSDVRLPVNMREARIITDGSEELFGELVGIFLGIYENQVTGIAEAVGSVEGRL